MVSPEVKRLFELAAQVAPELQAAFLAGECADPEVRAEVLALLRHADEAECYFDNIIRGVARSLLNRPKA